MREGEDDERPAPNLLDVESSLGFSSFNFIGALRISASLKRQVVPFEGMSDITTPPAPPHRGQAPARVHSTPRIHFPFAEPTELCEEHVVKLLCVAVVLVI